MKLLHLISTVDFRDGGPVEGMLRIQSALNALGHVNETLCLDAPQDDCVEAYPGVVHALGPARGGYRYVKALTPWLQRHARDFDVVIVNGLWQHLGLGTWRALRRSAPGYYVFSHGMLDPWFKQAYPLKHLKKCLYWPWAEYRVLRDANAVLFTCEDERMLARQSFALYRCRELISSYGTSAPPPPSLALTEAFYAQQPALRGKRLLLFLGRIHEKKGGDLLIDAFARLADSQPDLHLVMAGPMQPGWGEALRQHANTLAVADRICWAGMLSGDEKWGAFYASEAFCLPSHQENFGVAVAEALACGLPVLISDKVNIWREIQRDGAGLVAPDTPIGTLDLLQRWLRTDPEQRAEMQAAARQCFAQRFRIEAVARRLIEIFQGDATPAPAAGPAGASESATA